MREEGWRPRHLLWQLNGWQCCPRRERVKAQKKVGKKIMNLIFEHIELRNILDLIMLNISRELREFWFGEGIHQIRLGTQN